VSWSIACSIRSLRSLTVSTICQRQWPSGLSSSWGSRSFLTALTCAARASSTRGGDYRYRAWVSRDVLADGLAAMARDVDYANFKDEVARRDPERAHIYGRVWSVLGDIQECGPYS
jgi:hypothetical protein